MDSGSGHLGADTGRDGDAALCRTLLVEDDEPLRRRFESILSGWRGGRLVAACGTLGQAMAVLQNEPVDLLITDLRLPDGHGVQCIRRLRAINPQAEAMVVSALADNEVVIAAIEAGATGYLLKDVDSTDLIEAIEELRAGRSPISSSIARVIVRRLGERGQPPQAQASAPSREGAAALTPRETEILCSIAKGLTYAEVAEQLGLSRQTVPVHIKNIYRKLQVGNRSEAVFEASRLGLIWL
ncbi:response regulator transcription factor [Verticiella sediminum]|uniref:Response regulator transcription factor n=1 Tax=Verticiella sediminum TaxID=1247510 RepID=A0A556A7C1_9BURK|nr:response regulator transcription factor [Verticiella sediminum]TSH88774.1 response regulator transcription factor [Verticiella sediminum]